MFKSDYKWQHDYVRLASDTGFFFERHKPDNFDKNRITSIDIDRIIEERDFGTIENLIPTITKFVLDSEQAQVLDINFVKTFRLSQLSIEYLLFCKKYLDNTLIIIKGEVNKLKEENKELNLFVDDLKAHISNLMKEIDEKPSFKCTQCNKIFSSEEFLNSHIKRRHSAPLQEGETDKLQMEIKELKGRLNNAEKIIQKEQNEIEANVSKGAESKKIEELQQKFEDLRLHVQSEVKILQTQHNFHEKYGNWFEKMALQGSTSNTKPNDREGGDLSRRRDSTTHTKHNDREGGDLSRRRESTTQTDLEAAQAASDLVPGFEEKDKENIPEFSNAQKQISEFGEALETKVTSSLQKIETQMQSFWSKLNDMERHRKNFDDDEDYKAKPVIKPRGKYTVKNVGLEEEDATKNYEKSPKHKTKKPQEEIIPEERKISKSSDSNISSVRVVAAQLKKSPVREVEPEINLTEGDDTTTSETIASETEESKEEEIKPKPRPIPRKRPLSGTAKKADVNVIDEELLGHFRKEVEKIILRRLQDLGVSSEWEGLPTRSFQRALEIVNHQAKLMKKSHPNFDFISSQIEKNVTKKIEETKFKQPQRKVIKPKKNERRKPSSKIIGRVPSPRIEIKNRNMYDTDSESEVKPVQAKETLRQFSAPYSAVIEELKAVTSKIEAPEKTENVAKESEIKTEDQAKGVLKSYPSVGSLTKKKVLFNLSAEDDAKDSSVKDGGSTTSIASSVFDGTPRKEERKKKDREKDIEDLSDFDFSDM